MKSLARHLFRAAYMTFIFSVTMIAVDFVFLAAHGLALPPDLVFVVLAWAMIFTLFFIFSVMFSDGALPANVEDFHDINKNHIKTNGCHSDDSVENG